VAIRSYRRFTNSLPCGVTCWRVAASLARMPDSCRRVHSSRFSGRLFVPHAVAVVNGFIRHRHRSVEWRQLLPLIRRHVDTFEAYQVIAVPSGS
jgi:hypothetical protein